MTLGSWYIGIRAKHYTQRKQAHYSLRGALINGKVFASALAKHPYKVIPVRTAKGGHGDDETEPFEHGDNLPLFSGDLQTRLWDKFTDEAPSEVCGKGFDGYIQLTFRTFALNPLRYVRNQPFPSGSQWAKARWFTNPTSPDTEGEFSFTNQDNWIPATPQWDSFASPANWQKHLRRYINRVTSVLREEIGRAKELAESQDFDSPFEFGSLIECQDYKIRELETMWEFEDSDPCERVRSLKQSLIDLGRGELVVSIYRGQLNFMRHQGAETKEFNSTGIRVKLNKDTDLRVYPKTNKRVRFEIIQHNPNRAKLLAAAKIPFGSNEKKYSEIPALLKQARRTAANMLNTVVFPAIAAKPDLRIRQRSVVGFLADFAKACESARTLRDVMALLITNGGIQVGVPGKPLPSALGAIIDRLKGKVKLLVWSSARNGYEVAPRYRWALKQLRTADQKLIDSLLGSAPPRKR